MNVIDANMKQSLQTEAMRCLGDGTDTQRLDDFFNYLVELAGQLGNVALSLSADNRSLQMKSSNLVLLDLDVPRAKTKLRMLCARLSVRCREWCGRAVSPYGDDVDFDLPLTKQPCKVQFVNTTAVQELAIAIPSASSNGTSV